MLVEERIGSRGSGVGTRGRVGDRDTEQSKYLRLGEVQGCSGMLRDAQGITASW